MYANARKTVQLYLYKTISNNQVLVPKNCLHQNHWLLGDEMMIDTVKYNIIQVWFIFGLMSVLLSFILYFDVGWSEILNAFMVLNLLYFIHLYTDNRFIQRIFSFVYPGHNKEAYIFFVSRKEMDHYPTCAPGQCSKLSVESDVPVFFFFFFDIACRVTIYLSKNDAIGEI